MIEWLLDVSQIIIADIVLSGDNALIIGMAASAVPEEHRKKVIFIGLMAAAVLRILFALVASYLISVPGLLLLGGLLLFWVCWKFYQDIKEFSSSNEDGTKLKNDVSGKGLKAALTTIIIADVSMSLDNVIAITAIASSSTPCCWTPCRRSGSSWGPTSASATSAVETLTYSARWPRPGGWRCW